MAAVTLVVLGNGAEASLAFAENANSGAADGLQATAAGTALNAPSQPNGAANALPLRAASFRVLGAAEASVDVIVTVPRLNVRSGPGTNYALMGALARGARVTAAGKSPDGAWWQISYAGHDAYIYAAYTQLAGLAPSPAPAPAPGAGARVLVNAAVLNVRAGPGTGYAVIGQLHQGDVVPTTGGTSAWWKIAFNGRDGYVSGQYAVVTSGSPPPAPPSTPPPAPPPASSGAARVKVNTALLNVRTGPGTGHAVVGQLRIGAIVDATAKVGDWWKIAFDGREAYISAQYADVTTEAPPSAPAPGPAPASPPPPPAPPPAPPAGANGFELGGHVFSAGNLPAMRDIGMAWAKFQIVFTDNAPDLSGLANTVHSNGMKVLIGAVGDRARASDTNYHKAFAAQLAKMAAAGIDAIEVWNEPNLDREYGGSGTGKVSPENYANMLREAYGAIKAAHPATLVVGGATAPTGYFGGGCSAAGCDDEPFVQRLARAGGSAWMDCMGAHHNGTMVGPDTRSGAPVGSAFHHQWYFWGTLDTVYNAFGGRTKICWTELGYVTGQGIGTLPSGFSWGNSITLQNQADWLSRAAQLSRDSGKVRLMIIWNIDARTWNDDPQAGFSILRPDGSCPACAPIKTVMRGG